MQIIHVHQPPHAEADKPSAAKLQIISGSKKYV